MLANSGSKLKANASRHKALSWAHLHTIEHPLKAKVAPYVVALAVIDAAGANPTKREIEEFVKSGRSRNEALDRCCDDYCPSLLMSYLRSQRPLGATKAMTDGASQTTVSPQSAGGEEQRSRLSGHSDATLIGQEAAAADSKIRHQR